MMDLNEYAYYLERIFFIVNNNVLIYFYNEDGIEKYYDDIRELKNSKHLIEIVEFCATTGVKMFVFPIGAFSPEFDTYEMRQEAIVVLNKIVRGLAMELGVDVTMPGDVALKLQDFMKTTELLEESEDDE